MNVVAHNMLAANADRRYQINARSKRKTVEKLSSGYKLNRSADDAAGLSISEKMRNQIRGLNQAVDNSQDGISLIQTADGAMASIQSMLQRMTELCVQSANDDLTYEDRQNIQAEIDEIMLEIDTISDKTKFNDRYLLKGDNATIIGSNDPPTITGGLPPWGSMDSNSAANNYMSSTYVLPDGNHSATELDFSSFTGSADDIANAVGCGFYSTCCTCANHYSINFTDGTDSTIEQSGNHFVYNIGIGNAQTPEDVYNLIIAGTNNGHPNNHYTEMAIKDGKLIIYDNRPDVPANSTNGIIGPGVARSSSDPDNATQGDLYLQVGAKSGEDMKLSLPAMSRNNLGLSYIDVSTHQSSSEAINRIKGAIRYVNGERSKMGAYQNRLEYTINHLENYSENLTYAESMIRDADMASEMTKLSKENILDQVGQAMITQANQTQEGVLSLLK